MAEMSEKKKRYESGATKRKNLECKKQSHEQQVRQMPKLWDMGFSRSTPTTSAGSSSSKARETDSLDKPVDDPAEPSLASSEIESTHDQYEIETSIRTAAVGDPSKSNDAGEWGNVTDTMREYWIQTGPEKCQNHDCDFSKSERRYSTQARNFSKGFLYRKHVCGEELKREWLLYSPSKGSVFCFACKLFAKTNDTFSHGGFNDWKHGHIRIKEHENSLSHRESMLTWTLRRKHSGQIETSLDIQFQKEKEYWQNVLKRVVSTVKFLATRGLAFRGGSEKLNSPDNGNFLGILELISEFDPFLSNHLARYGNQGKGRASYLSSTICQEVIEILGDKLLSAIISGVKESKYFSLSVDSTPDLCHIDQLTVILRYVQKSTHQVAERFLQFLPIENHTGEYLANEVLSFLNKHDIDVANMRSQSYDNASNMSGCYNGMQAKVREVNPFALYVPCAAHSLNLVGVCAVDSCPEAVAFFGLVQQLYVYFSASTHRWSVLKDSLGVGPNLPVLKRLSDTRWSAHADSVKALSVGYTKIQDALNTLSLDQQQKADSRLEAQGLLKKMSHLETVVLAHVWNVVLERINMTSQSLQKESIELGTAVKLLKSLREFINGLRDRFDEFEKLGQEKSVCKQYRDTTKRVVKRKRQFDEGKAPDTVFSGSDKFRVGTFLPIIDSLCTALDKRIGAYEHVNDLFGFLTDFRTRTEGDREESCKKLQTEYQNDLEPAFVDEFAHFCYFLEQSHVNDGERESVQTVYNILMEHDLTSTFPNVEVALRMYLTLMITNCSGERSFSKLKLIENEKRSCMVQERLNHLSLMAIEHELLQTIDVSDVLKTFSLRKERKVNV